MNRQKYNTEELTRYLEGDKIGCSSIEQGRKSSLMVHLLFSYNDEGDVQFERLKYVTPWNP